ncbi:hypothetical protein SLS62_007028 [Diatrype stigma]|uniref:Major facilitator superfamily (MFS) profile domain-containing protein n=1 Tax=Diatrype stigma TaxID=117547 RepID=A0AAN9V046_9PEZI
MATADDQAAPLISHRHHREDGDNHDGLLEADELQSDTGAAAEEANEADEAEFRHREGRIGSFVWLLTLSACISGLLFGCKRHRLSIGTSLSGQPLTSLDKSLITSATALLALAASPLAARLADAAGRRPVILGADVLFAAGALLQARAGTVAAVVAGRAVVGAAVGAASFATPLYVAELAPAARRGGLVTLNVLCVTLGQVVAYVVGWALVGGGDGGGEGWRWLVGLGAVPAVLQAVLLLLLMPETPRWLVRAGRPAAARRVIWSTVAGSSGGEGKQGRDRDGEEEEDRVSTRLVDRILKDIETEVREEEEERRRALAASGRKDGGGEWVQGWRELLSVPRNRRALTIACLLQALQQLCGFNSLMYFSATIFTLLGFQSPTLTSLSVAGTNFLFTAVALAVIDRVGRRRILLWSVPIMAVGLLLCAVGFRFFNLPPAAETPTPHTTAAVVILVSIMVYVAAYALGLGNVPWMQSELFPLSVRSLGSGAATCANWTANFAVGLTFLPMMDALTPTWTFVLYALVCAVGWVAIWLIYPETSGLTLEEATGLLEHGWGVVR